MNEKIEFINLFLKDKPGLYKGRIDSKFSGTIKELSGIIKMRITIVDYNGKVIADSDHDPLQMDNHRYRLEINESIKNKKGESIRHSDTLNLNMLYLARDTGKYIIRLAKPLKEIDNRINRLKADIIYFGLFALLIAIIFTTYISQRITRPIRETREFAESFSDGDYSKRILNFSDDEIGILQKSLNRMADRIVSEIDKLILEQNKLKITIESTSDGIAVIDNNKRVLIANKAFLSLLEINSNVINKVYFEVIRGSSFNKRIQTALSNSKNAHYQEKLHTGRYCDVFIIPIKEEQSLQGILIVLHDITEKKKIDQLKTELVGNLSHELKTPIAILKGYIETIQSNLDDTGLCTDFLKKAVVNIDRQDSIINDMLKLNRLETLTEIPVEKISLKEIISNCVDILSAKAKAKEIEIKQNIEMPDEKADGNKLLAEEIFFNIIINAINYTNPGGTIKIESQNETGRTVISITDSGIGIPEDSIDRIFERFYRVDKSRSRATGGTGLGLSIVKHAADILNWDIKVKSGTKGTTFYIYV